MAPVFQTNGLLAGQPHRDLLQVFKKDMDLVYESVLWAANCGDFRTYWQLLAETGVTVAVSASSIG